MKRFFLAAVLFGLMAIFSAGCSHNEDYKSPGTLAKERQTEIMECFINKDGETLKSFFSEYVMENVPDLESQIEEAFDFLDGEIVSYDEPFPSTCGSLEQKDYGAHTFNIITDQGTEYTIGFKGWLTNEKEPRKVGTTVIVVRNETINNGSDELFRLCIGQTD